jgi:tRNA(Ile2) C34 agmatinyltransferase TiaS
MSLAIAIHDAIDDATDAFPTEPMDCPYCGAAADRAGGPFYYWKCPECRAFGTTFDWAQEHKYLKAVGRKSRKR